MSDSDREDEFDVFKFLRLKLGITALLTLVNGLRDGQRQMNDRLDLLQKLINQGQRKLMALIQEVFQAQSESAVLIADALDAIAAEVAEHQAALEAAVAGTASPEQLQEALANAQSINQSLGRVKESVAAIVPTIASPTPENPLPPVLDVLPVPETLDDVTITETAENVALDGVVAIDLPSVETNQF